MREILKQIVGAPAIELVPGASGDILLLSMRRVAALAANCMQYEFEDIIVDTSGADRAEPTRLELSEFERRVYKALHKATVPPQVAKLATTQLGGLRLNKTYDLFLPVFNDPYELFALSQIPNWRKHCRYAACLITEAWEAMLPKYLLETLSEFDHIYLSSNPTESVSKITGRPCSYLPLGIDALGFCPYPNPPARAIDVLGIGRRSPETHAALLALARERGFFYYFDTIRMTSGVADAGRQLTFSVLNSAEHRFKLASMLKRSRFFMASRARANEWQSAHLDEMSGRFFEGAAAGAIMIGEPPRSGKYLELFDWPDAVVRTPFDAPHIGETIAELEADPERCVRIRRNNMVNALLRHDCAHRYHQILNDAGIAAPPGLLSRERRLRELADIVRDANIAP
ncbi:MAG TPA: glycosyltransferase [Polyangiaceae bacterium]|nr:glycosyltransferase [Polyangiaceae bacterium]